MLTVDPDVSLWEMRAIAAACLRPGADADQEGQADRAVVLSELVAGMDDWLCRGGYLPSPWRRGRRPGGSRQGGPPPPRPALALVPDERTQP